MEIVTAMNESLMLEEVIDEDVEVEECNVIEEETEDVEAEMSDESDELMLFPL
ncbi:hypothetical protein [Paenibacillus sp. FSL H7-0331]|uniref:hypothetical protein n=1 Tax=Paenibacillus sp. FSL H7-0331 TaxID=1920421 RepID=UPI0015C33620|nr:hypothetical protein [Paenibacillus sp. FSL H7-0331]